MSVVADHGIILRVRPYRDTSVIVHWLAAESGRITTSARAARGPKSPFLGKVDLCVEADFFLRRSSRGDVHTLREVVPTDFHAGVRRDVASLAILAHAVGCLEQVTESETPQPEVFELFRGLVGFLERHGPRPRAIFAWELRFLAIQGLEPDSGRDFQDESGRLLLLELQQREWDGLAELAVNGAAVRGLDRFLHGFWIHHFGKLPKARAGAFQAASESARRPAAASSIPDFNGNRSPS
jgi:hypothetical protein